MESCTNPLLNDHTSVGILFVSLVSAVDLSVEHFDRRKLYNSSFAWFPFGV